MDNVERAIEKGVSSFKQVLNDNQFVNGGGSIEALL